jgi:2,3-dihydroxyphenylpropionate 1,2-dioxygenase
MSARAFLGLSHTPLMGLNPIDTSAQDELQASIKEMQKKILAFDPELIVLVAPDHYNGFFNDLMPAFCIGTQATAVGDYLSPAGALNVDGKLSAELVSALMDDEFDVAISHRMQVDHGFAQPLQLIWSGLATPPIVPIFVNAASPPVIPRLRRCRSLGEAIGRFFATDSRRILFLGSGGLSHEPPVPTMADPDSAVRERITVRKTATKAEQDAKMQRVMAAGMALASGKSAFKPINPSWDKAWMDALASNDDAMNELCKMPESVITEQGGRSAHESKNWLIARSALLGGSPLACTHRFYQSIPEYIAGFGILLLEQVS